MALKVVSGVAALVASLCGATATAAAPTYAPRVQLARPTGWAVVERAAWLRMIAPEGDFTIDTIEIERAADARAAVDAAWKIADPAFRRALLQSSQDAAGDGWAERWSFAYVTTPDERLMVRANAMRSGTTWTVTLLRGSVATVQKRSGAIIAAMESLRPAGYIAEDFTGKLALPFNAERRDALKAFWREAMAAYGVPGIGYAFFDRNGIVEEGGLGVARIGASAPITAHTRFHIASNTKGMTTLLIARLVDQGKLRWDEPVTEAYPSFRIGDAATLAAIRIRHLVCACTGMPRQDLDWMIAGNKSTPATHVFDLLATAQPTTKFGEAYQYSNLLAAAGGYVAAHVAHPTLEVGAAYDRAMREQVFAPLGMRDTTLDTPTALATDHAYPHDVMLDGETHFGPPDAGDSIHFARPAGGAWSSAHDVALFALNELREGKLPSGKQLLSREALLERRRGGVEYGEATRYGMGLETIARWGVPILHHGGALPGWGTDWFVLPEAGVGVVLLMNSESGREIEESTRRRIVELLYGARPEAAAAVRAGGAALRADVAEAAKRITVPPSGSDLSRLAHRYTNPQLGELTIERRAPDVLFHFPAVTSRAGTWANADGSTSFVLVDPAAGGWRLQIRSVRGKHDVLVLREPQREYVYTPFD